MAPLAQAGAEEVWPGAESGSQHILDAMDKGTTIDQVRIATRNLRAEGILVGWFIQLGYLGEEWDDIVLTRNLVRDEPLPDTRFYDMVGAQMGTKDKWSDSSDLAMMFRGPFSSDTHRQIRDRLHAEVEPDARTEAATCRDLDARSAEVERTASNARAAVTP
jgi:anaerobic magnesium-protoporphyrin IX monomethyl ester cyclase